MSLFARLPVEPLRLISFHLFASPSRSYASSIALLNDKKKYSHTLLLPKCHLPTKHKNPAEFEEGLRRRISDELYQWQATNNTGPKFVFLDGPPYANGNLHMGHALNKVLKDMINRYKVLRGHNVQFIPGWDCHGLPIEQKALADLGQSHTTLSPVRIREVARQSALEAISVQKQEMKELGIMADWDGPDGTYRTMDHTFEVRQLRLFQTMLSKGLIAHRLRPTYYSPAARTALAEAELKYEDDHKSRSVYVEFPVDVAGMSDGLYNALKSTGEPQISLAIWTTTPWTLASNMGVAVHRDLTYLIVKTVNGKVLVVQEDRLEPMSKIIGDLSVLGTIKGSDLIGTNYSHSFSSSSAETKPVIMHADHVSTESGTGIVHMAPAHGHEDYLAFMSAGILSSDLRCPVDDDGKFTSAVLDWSSESPSLVGKEVLGAGNAAMIDLLRNAGVILAEQNIRHRYPYDWKTKTPTIIRATPQWFADVAGIKASTLRAMEDIDFHPPQSRHRLEAFVTSRSEWCISRQRSWGVPIPILFTPDGEPVLTEESIQHNIAVLSAKGIDHWWAGSDEDFIPPSQKGANLVRGRDTLDVWFDSGSAWTMLDSRGSSLPLADVCLEGSDQHRGWFQSSLLTRLSQEAGGPPVSKAIITHGFIVDEKGKKMSKSDGNGISPTQIINGDKGKPGYGADTLRMWVASVDYHRDVALGPSSISQASDMLRKWRSVLRFIVGSGSENYENCSQRSLMDRYILLRVQETEQVVVSSYEQFAFNKALQSINAFTGTTLSSIYFDSIKDILYSDPEASPRRQAVIATLREVLQRLLRMMAPIAPHLAQEFFEASSPESSTTIFSQPWDTKRWESDTLHSGQDHKDMETILSLRPHVLALLEASRAVKQIRSSGEADLYITDPPADLFRLLQENASTLPGLFTSSRVILGPAPAHGQWSRAAYIDEHGDLKLSIVPALRHQCWRCWQHTAEADTELCGRCASCLSSKTTSKVSQHR